MRNTRYGHSTLVSDKLDTGGTKEICIIICLCSQAMESKLLVGGKTITDHTNEQQKMLELKRQEIAEQVINVLYNQ